MSKRRGKPSNRRHSDALRGYVSELVRAHDPDVGRTLATEKLAERHHVSVSRETVRQWMIEAGLWTSSAERNRRVQQPRPCPLRCVRRAPGLGQLEGDRQ